MSREVVNADFTGDNLSEMLGHDFTEDKWDEIIETMLHKALFDEIERTPEGQENMRMMMITLLEISLGKDDDKDIPKFLDKINSVLIYHKDPKKWDKREIMCAYMNTICAWSEIFGNDADIYRDNKAYVISDLYAGLQDFVYNKLKRSKRKLISYPKFKKYLQYNGLIKQHGSTHNGKPVKREIVYNLRQKKHY